MIEHIEECLSEWVDDYWERREDLCETDREVCEGAPSLMWCLIGLRGIAMVGTSVLAIVLGCTLQPPVGPLIAVPGVVAAYLSLVIWSRE